MCAAWVSSFVRLPDFTRTTTFRWTLAVAGAFGVCILVFSGFVYWEVAAYTTSRTDGLLIDELRVITSTRSVQTNEVGRSPVLVAGTTAVQRRFDRPLDDMDFGQRHCNERCALQTAVARDAGP